MTNKLFTQLGNFSVVIVLIVAGALFAAFYPQQYVSIDEYDYVRNATLLQQQVLRQDCEPNQRSQFAVNNNGENYCISKYNLGTSFFLALSPTPQLMAVVSFVAFMVGVAAFHLILRRLGIDLFFTYFYAFYPALFYYSRTRFSETFSAMLLTVFVYTVLRHQASRHWYWGILAGTAAGLAVLTRYTNVLPLAILIFGMLVWPENGLGMYLRVNLTNYVGSFTGRIKRGLKLLLLQLGRVLPVLLGGAPWAIIFLFINTHLYGSFFRSGYYYSGEEGVIIFAQIPQFILRFAGVLSIVLPLMLPLALFGNVKHKWSLISAVAVTMVFYAGFPSTFFEGRILDFITGIRFLVPVIPLILIPYAAVVQNLIRKYPQLKLILIISLVGLISVAAAVSYIHQGFLTTNGVVWPQLPR